MIYPLLLSMESQCLLDTLVVGSIERHLCEEPLERPLGRYCKVKQKRHRALGLARKAEVLGYRLKHDRGRMLKHLQLDSGCVRDIK